MDKVERKRTNEILFIILIPTTIILITDWCFRFSFLSPEVTGFYKTHVNDLVKPQLFYIRLVHIVLMALLGWNNTKFKDTPSKNYAFHFISVLSVTIFLSGYTRLVYYNLLFYPFGFVAGSILVLRTLQEIHNNQHESKNFKLVPKAPDAKDPLIIDTASGRMQLPERAHGTYIEAAAGGGKSNLIENFLWQEVQGNKAGFLYDYEGNPLERDGAILTKTVYTALKQTPKDHKVKFAFINFTDLTKTVRCNPIASRYMGNELDVLNAAHTFMKNLERDWIKKTDFWAQNALNYTTGCMLYQQRHMPDHMRTIPHLICLMLSDFRAVLDMMTQDHELQKWIIPIATAYEMKAHQQISGVVSSTQLPVTKLFLPEIFYVLNPPVGEEFDLDITNPSNPVFLCVGNNPKQKQALSPVISLIFSVVKNNIDKLDQTEAVICIDEVATCFFNGIDEIPATMRKKGVSTYISVQSFIQLIRDYGKENAETLRDNLSNVFIGKTNNKDTAHRIMEFFGDYRRNERSTSMGDSGESQTLSTRNEKLLQLRDITFQRTGHWTGYISNADPAMFHTQFKRFNIKKLNIPAFAKPISSDDTSLVDRTMKKILADNFIKVQNEIRDYIAPYMPAESESA